jgi:SAM-dependent methyltransferase
MQPDEYRKMAEVEDAMWYYRALHHHVIRNLSRQLSGSTLRHLDAGCGTGGLLRGLHAAQPGWRLTGVDFSPLACELARERSSAEIVQGSIAALPFPAESFDAMSSCDVVCQVTEPAQAMREFHRCLKPGGAIVVTMPAYQWLFSYHDREVGNLRRYSRRELNDLLVGAGFTIERSTYWNTLPFPLAVLRRKILPPAKARSDVAAFPPWLEALLNGLMALEQGWLALGGRFPFGTSVLTVARKS